MRVEYFGAIRAIEAFDVRVLIRLARLDVVDRHAVAGAPIDKGLRREFRTVVDANRQRAAMDNDEGLEHANDATTRSDTPATMSKPSRFPSSIIVSSRTRRAS